MDNCDGADAAALDKLKQLLTAGGDNGVDDPPAAAAAPRVPAAGNALSPPKAGPNLDFSQFPNRPIALISPEVEDGVEVLKVNDEALDLIRGIHVPVSVLAVSGLYRTGKSSLMNWLVDPVVNASYGLGDAGEVSGGEGFKVGATVQRCTRGIWLWGRPRAVELADGMGQGALLILDTEGLGGLESEGRYDARIFALATLLCSTLAYNSLGTIDEKAIGALSFIAQLSRNIRLAPEAASSAGDSKAAKDKAAEAAEAAALRRFFPSFVWIVRDFALELQDEDGNEISADEYLEVALRPQSGAGRYFYALET